MTLPGFDFIAPEVQPARSGLYEAATVTDVTGLAVRPLEGARIWPTNCGPAGTWPSELCPDPAPPGEKGGDRPEASDLFLPVTVWAWDECGNGITEAEAGTRARHLLDINERSLVEAAFATRLLADAGASLGTGYGFGATAARALQAGLGEGLNVILHTAATRVLEGVAQGVVTKSGTARLEQFGNSIAWGGGYTSLDDIIIATGQVFVWRGEATVVTHFETSLNLNMALAERTVLVAYEPCFIGRWDILDIPPGGSGGGGTATGFTYPAP